MLEDEDLRDDEGETFSEPEDHMSDITANNLIVTNAHVPQGLQQTPRDKLRSYRVHICQTYDTRHHDNQLW